MVDWQEHTTKTYEAKHGGVYASVAQFGQAWIGRIWSAANGGVTYNDRCGCVECRSSAAQQLARLIAKRAS